MKHIRQSLFMLATALFAACTSDGTDGTERTSQTPLQIELAEVMTTRAATTGTMLPDGSQYGIFVCQGQSKYTVNGGNNVCVDYAYGKSTPATTTLLSDDDCNIYAYYPYNTKATLTGLGLPIHVSTQTDYLYGTSADSGGTPILVNSSQPKARIRFNHAMALLTLCISQDGDRPEKPNVVTSISLHDIATYASLNVMTGHPVINKLDGYGGYTLDCNITATATPHTADVLLIPMTTENGLSVTLTINGKGYGITLPTQEWKAGVHYTYNVKIRTTETTEAALEISEAVITPRENVTMSELTLNANILAIGGTIGTPVDLGLSVKWADHNVGASSESDVGGLYYWGDPTGTATFSTYKRPDLYEISSTQYDIATIQWGGNWQMPTYNEVIELIEKTSHQWTMRNGVEGFLFTSTIAGYTDKSIFFPYYRESSNYKSGSVWTGHRLQSNKTYATILLIDNKEGTGHNNAGSTLQATYAVRPVCK